MSYSVRKGSDEVHIALVTSFNAMREDVAKSGSYFHKDVLSTQSGYGYGLTTTAHTVDAADGDGTIATLQTLVKDIIKIYNLHIADTVAHKVADTTNTLTSSADPADLAACESRLNDVKAKLNTHHSQAGVHVNNDGTNTIAAVDATDQASSDTLANEIKSKLNLHMASAPKGASLVLVDA